MGGRLRRLDEVGLSLERVTRIEDSIR